MEQQELGPAAADDDEYRNPLCEVGREWEKIK